MGKGMLFEPDGGKVAMQHITKGASNTAMAIDASAEFETIWTKPGDRDRIRQRYEQHCTIDSRTVAWY
jgi:hypothetical protein